MIQLKKSVSNSDFSWKDTVVVTLSMKNNGADEVNNITVTEYVPDVFEGSPSTLIDSTGKLNITRNSLQPNEEMSYSYTIKGKEDLGTKLNVTLRGFQVSYSDADGISHLKMSEDVALTVNPAGLQTTDLLVQSALLLFVSFVFGLFGSFINNLSVVDPGGILPGKATIKGVYKAGDKDAISFEAPESAKANKQFSVQVTVDPDSLSEIKDGSYRIAMQLSRKNDVWRKEATWSKQDKTISINLTPEISGEHSLACSIINAEDQKVVKDYATKPVTINVRKSLAYDLLVGGVAGIITLASLEALSAIFVDKGLDITVKTVVTLIVTCLAAGFVPTKIIENYTKTLTKEKEEAEKQRDNAQEAEQESSGKLALQNELNDVKKKYGL